MYVFHSKARDFRILDPFLDLKSGFPPSQLEKKKTQSYKLAFYSCIKVIINFTVEFNKEVLIPKNMKFSFPCKRMVPRTQ